VHPRTREALSIREDILATLRRLAPHAQALGSEAALADIEHAAGTGGNHARYLRQVHGRSGSVQAVVQAAVGALRSGVLS
jgi:carboxylate-amine ligase